MTTPRIVNIFYASADELKLGINEMDSEITTALHNGNMEAVKKATLLKNAMSSLLDNKQKGGLVQKTCPPGEKADSSVEITDAMAYAFHAASGDGAIGSDDVEEIKRGLRAVINECSLTNHLVKIPAGLHGATAQLVVNFASEMAGKLYRAQEKYGRGADWAKSDWKDECLKELHRHLSKGDPRDVAAYCMFLWHHGWLTRSELPATAGISERVLFESFMKDDYSPDSSGSVSEEEERVFLEVLFHIWQGRAAVQNGLTQQEMDIIMKHRELQYSVPAIDRLNECETNLSDSNASGNLKTSQPTESLCESSLVQIRINIPITSGNSEAEIASKLHFLSSRLKDSNLALTNNSVIWSFIKEIGDPYTLSYSHCHTHPGFFPADSVNDTAEQVINASTTIRFNSHEFVLLVQAELSVSSEVLAAFISAAAKSVLSGETSGMKVNKLDGYAFMMLPRHNL